MDNLNKCTSMNVVHYADDSTVYMMGGSLDSLICITNYISKSQFFMFSKITYNNSGTQQIRGQVLPQCSHTKFLDKVIGDNLYFFAHITTVCN